MIVDFIAGLLHAILAPVFALLPSGSLTSWFGITTSLAESFAGKSYVADAFLPMHEIANLVAAAAGIFIPAVLTYRVANWVYRHIPQLGGFGPGSG